MPAEPFVLSPASLAEAHAALGRGEWRPMAGATDLLVQISGELGPTPERVLDLWQLDELRGISVIDDRLHIGSLTTFSELRGSALVVELLPVASEIAATIGAAQIQNRGTVGGNLANASPAGDTLPLWLASDADIVLTGPFGERVVSADAFFLGYRQTALRPDELVLRVEVPLVPHRQYRFRKVGTRQAQAISKVVMVISWVTTTSGAWTDSRVALGSVAATPVRSPATEAVLEGHAPTEELADRAAAALMSDIEPIDDVRSTADYRRLVAGRILHRIIREAGGW
jgi:CO/xanthine dehydrogenase FAD-binding subunit